MSTGPLPARINPRKLAVENSRLEGVIALVKFGRLVEALESSEGVVQVKLEFRKGKKHKVIIIGHVSTCVTLVCQNCLAAMEYELEASFQYLVVESESDLAEIAEGEDGIVCPDEKILLVAMIEDELIMSLPMVSRHGDHECQPMIEHKNDDCSIKPQTHRPFTGLAELKNELNRS